MANANTDALIATLNNLGVDPADHGALVQALDDLNNRLPQGTAMSMRTLVPPPSGAAADEPTSVASLSTNEATIIDARSVQHPYARLAVGYAALLGHSHVYSGATDDVIAGDAADQDINAGEGNDIAYGGGGNDTLYGQMGADLLYGNQGNDTMNGNQGADTLFGGRGDDIVLGGQDDDYLNGNMGNDLVNGNLGNDEVHGGQGNDTVHGGQGNDVLWGELGDDLLSGDMGNDTLFGGVGIDRFFFGIGGGKDVIADFDIAAGERIVQVGHSGYTVDQDGAGNAVIVFSTEDSVTLAGVSKDQVSADWFITV